MSGEPRPHLDIEALLGLVDRGGIADAEDTLQDQSPDEASRVDAVGFNPRDFLDAFNAPTDGPRHNINKPEPEPVQSPVYAGRIAVTGLQQSGAKSDILPKPSTLPDEIAIKGGSRKREVSNVSSNPDDDLVRIYLNEIGQVPLLTKEDEVNLAQKMEAGKAAEERLNSSGENIPLAERRQLSRQKREGQRAEKRFIESNLRLVVSIARKYRASGLPLLDLIQEGNIGLMHGVEKFDWRKGFKFSTYGTWWIRQAITRGIANTGRTIRLPVHAVDDLNTVLKARTKLERDGIRPTIEALVVELEMNPDRVVEILSWAHDPLSLSEPLGEDKGSSELVDLIPDSRSGDGYEQAEMSDLSTIIGKALDDILDEREATILKMRFAIEGGEQPTLEQIGERFNLTRERIRQIEARAMTKLRHPSNGGVLEALRDFLID